MDFIEALINILAIIGIIVAGGFIIFFLGDLLLSILEPKTEETKIKEGDFKLVSDEDLALRERLLKEEKQKFIEEKLIKERTRVLEESKKELVEVKAVEEIKIIKDIKAADNNLKKVDYAMAAEEEKKIQKTDPQPVLNPVKVKEEEERERRLQAIEERRLNLMQEIEEEEKIDLEDIDFSESEVIETLKPVSVPEVIEEEDDENEKISLKLVEEINSQRAEIERLRQELAGERTRNNFLEKQTQDFKTEVRTEYITKGPLLSREEYEAMLATNLDRLRILEKQFKQVNKEYLPLMRINKTLKRDEAKLGRKEALVAKQKTVLYGVNNYADIDEEKAKKLAEDLDLLDGLKLSVAHCEEVMAKNKDKYPVLENTHNILKNTIENIKNDIATIEEALRKLDEQENGSMS